MNEKKLYLTVFENPLWVPIYQITDWVIVWTWCNLNWWIAITRVILEYLCNKDVNKDNIDLDTQIWTYKIPNYSTNELNSDLELIKNILNKNDQTLDYIDLSQKGSNIKVLRAVIYSDNPKKSWISKHIVSKLIWTI